MELHKRRGALTEPEVRYYMKQISSGVGYLHNQDIIHRDLKLGNVFLDDDMQVKLGDLGLAVKLMSRGDKRNTLCGTPNYIAPEILVKKGHSFEVDIWSMGCIMYTMLVGKPPFETNSLKETYSKIKKCEYIIPEDKIGQSAGQLITVMLHPDPNKRPLVKHILEHDFIKVGYMPNRLPTSTLTVAPRLTAEQMSFSTTRRPLVEVQRESPSKDHNQNPTSKDSHKDDNEVALKPRPTFRQSLAPTGPKLSRHQLEEQNKEKDLLGIVRMIDQIMSKRKADIDDNMNPRFLSSIPEDCEHPASTPIYWISKWVDYSDKYGIGYQLCDNSVGVLYNDSTRMILHENGEQVQYLNKEMKEEMCLIDKYPSELKKKVSLITYFRKYMNDHLLKAGAACAPKEGDSLARLPCLRTWFRTRSAICLWLSNGTIQINWFESHDKVVFCPKMEAITMLLSDGNSITFKTKLIAEHGITEDLFIKLKYARNMVRKLQSNSSSRPTSSS